MTKQSLYILVFKDEAVIKVGLGRRSILSGFATGTGTLPFLRMQQSLERTTRGAKGRALREVKLIVQHRFAVACYQQTGRRGHAVGPCLSRNRSPERQNQASSVN
jgi:hypothetical protein